MAYYSNFHTHGDIKNLLDSPEPIKLVIEPDHPLSVKHYMCLTFQMQYTLALLEHELSVEGNPHLLQLRWETYSLRDELYQWFVFADGSLILEGNYDWAIHAFRKDAYSFSRKCREAVEGIPTQSSEQYETLVKVQRLIELAQKDDEFKKDYEDTTRRIFSKSLAESEELEG